MNKNAIFALIGLGVFVVLALVLWDRGDPEEAAPARPAATAENEPAEEPSPAPGGDTTKPEPGPAGEETGGETTAPVEPGVEEPATPGGEETAGAGGTGETGETTGTTAPAGTPEEKARITADTGEVDSETLKEAAGHQDVPVPWLASEEEGSPPAGPVFPRDYTVPSDTSLYRVAEVVYGDAGKWQVIFEANKAILEDPEAVKAGTVLVIPDPKPGAGSGPVEKKKTSLTDGLY